MSLSNVQPATAEYVLEDKAFGKPLIQMQNARFKLAKLKLEAELCRVLLVKTLPR